MESHGRRPPSAAHGRPCGEPLVTKSHNRAMRWRFTTIMPPRRLHLYKILNGHICMKEVRGRRRFIDFKSPSTSGLIDGGKLSPSTAPPTIQHCWTTVTLYYEAKCHERSEINRTCQQCERGLLVDSNENDSCWSAGRVDAMVSQFEAEL